MEPCKPSLEIYNDFIRLYGTLLRLRNTRNCGIHYREVAENETRLINITHLVAHLQLPPEIFESTHIFVQEDENRQWGLIYILDARCCIYASFKRFHPTKTPNDGILFKSQTLIHSHVKTSYENVKVNKINDETYQISLKVASSCTECGYEFSSSLCKRTVRTNNPDSIQAYIEILRHQQKKAKGHTLSRHYITSCAAHNSFVDYETYKNINTAASLNEPLLDTNEY